MTTNKKRTDSELMTEASKAIEALSQTSATATAPQLKRYEILAKDLWNRSLDIEDHGEDEDGSEDEED